MSVRLKYEALVYMRTNERSGKVSFNKLHIIQYVLTLFSSWAGRSSSWYELIDCYEHSNWYEFISCCQHTGWQELIGCFQHTGCGTRQSGT
jgi:hypothetical protein